MKSYNFHALAPKTTAAQTILPIPTLTLSLSHSPRLQFHSLPPQHTWISSPTPHHTWPPPFHFTHSHTHASSFIFRILPPPPNPWTPQTPRSTPQTLDDESRTHGKAHERLTEQGIGAGGEPWWATTAGVPRWRREDAQSVTSQWRWWTSSVWGSWRARAWAHRARARARKSERERERETLRRGENANAVLVFMCARYIVNRLWYTVRRS